MQTDAGLVQHIQHAGQRTADLRGQADALAFAARKRAGPARKSQVIQPHIFQKSQAVFDLLQNTVANAVLLLGKLHFLDKVQFLADALFAKIADIHPAHSHCQAGGLQASAMAVGAGAGAHHPGNFLLHPLAAAFAEAALQVGDNALKRGFVIARAKSVFAVQLQRFSVCAVQNSILPGLRDLFKGSVQRKAVFIRQCLIIHFTHAALGVIPAAGLDSAFPDRAGFIRHDQLGVHLHKSAKARAGGAGAERVVEAEHTRRKLFHGNVMLRAGIALAELHALAADHVHGDQRPRELQGGFQRIAQAAADSLAHDKAVHHNLHRVLFVFLQSDLFVKIVQVSVNAHTGITGAAGGIQLLLLCALAAAHHRGKNLKFCSLGQL